jgi:hypothetical protein
MTVEAWPTGVNYAPNEDSWAEQPYLAPIRSEMDGGNLRERTRPGDEVRVIQQTISMSNADYEDTVKPFLEDNRGRRVTMPVWLGAAFTECLVQIIDPRATSAGHAKVNLSMTVRVIRAVS